MKYSFASVLFLFGLTISSTQQASAWGGRGHDTICQTAVQLVQDKDLRAFLLFRPHIMGHLCNVPDVHWKSMSADLTKEGNPTHYISSEMLGIPLKELPLDLTALTAKFNGTDNQMVAGKKITNLPYDMGTSWWRANQLFDMAVDSAKVINAQSLPAPTNSKEQQDSALPYNKAIYDMMVYMGIMGHFVGDNGQAFHTNFDHDGYEAGHGGIHAFFEEIQVAYFDADLSAQIAMRARAINADPVLRTFIEENSTLEKMRALGGITFNDIGDVLKADMIDTPSTLKPTKAPAVRKSPEVAQKVFADITVTEMARSALLLAKLWDDIYAAAGKPSLASYRSYRYPLTPDFIMPNYYEIKPVAPPVAPVVPAVLAPNAVLSSGRTH